MSTNLRIDGERLLSRLAALSRIGATPEGGCRRLALTDEDKAGRDWLVGELKALGLDVRVDAIGNIVGILKGLDQSTNVVLEDSNERVFSSDTGVEQVALGLYIVRGDSIALIGEIDQDVDAEINFADVVAEPLKPVVH